MIVGLLLFSYLAVSDYLRPHGLEPARLLCPSPSPRTQTHLHWVSDVIQPSCPLSSPSPPAFSLSPHRSLFQWVGYLHQVAKVLEFQLQHQSFQWMFRTYSFRMDWLDLLAVQGTLKSLLQHHSLRASILWRSAFFMVQVCMDLLGRINKKSGQCAVRQQVALSLRRVMWPVGKSRGPWEPITKLDLIK